MVDRIDGISSMSPITPIKRITPPDSQSQTQGAKGVTPDFGKILAQALEEVNQNQKTAERMADDFAAGKISNIHDVIISAEQAAMSLRLTTEIRNKIVDAYREIMRMQL